MPTEPTRQASVGTVLETLRVLLKGEGDLSPTLAAVHRLDVNTSGIVIIAQTKDGAAALSEPFRSGEVKRRYVALVHGTIEDAAIRIEAPLARGRDPGHMVVDKNGKRARTLVAPLARGTNTTLVSVIPMTGRMHQIRVHLAEIGHPIVGDIRYGASRDRANEGEANDPFCLHAVSLALVDPRSQESLQFSSLPPPEFFAACRHVEIPEAVVATAARPMWELA
jgi:RluA family pseudouridine synthase